MNRSFFFFVLLLLVGNFHATVARISFPPPCLNLSVQLTSESCPGNGDGAIDLSVSGGQAPYSYLWSTGDGVQDLQGLTTGSYAVTVTDSLGCEVTDTFFVGLLGPAPIADAGRDTFLCSDGYQLLGNMPTNGSGSWQVISGQGTLSSPFIPFPTVSGLSAGPNLFAWVWVQGACADADTVEVYLSHAAVVDAGLDDSLCGNAYGLNGSPVGNGSGMWSAPGGTALFSTPASPVAVASNLSPGINFLVWSVTEAHCNGADTVNIEVLQGAEADFSFAAMDLEVAFTDLSISAASVKWNFGDGDSSLQASPTHLYAAPGTYSACQIALDSCGNDTFCKDVTVTCADPTAAFGYQLLGMQVDFVNNSSSAGGAVDWHWDFGDGDTSSLENPSHVYASPGIYQVCLEVEDVCGEDDECESLELNIVALNQALATEVRLWPQPVMGDLHLSLMGQSGQEVSFSLLSAEGRLVKRFSKWIDQAAWEMHLEVGDLPSGMYLLQLKGEGIFHTARFTKF